MDSRNETFGGKLRRLREEADGNVRMADLASAINVSVVYVSDIERDRRNPPSPDKIAKMLAVLGKEDCIEDMLRLAVKSRKSVEISVERQSECAIHALASLARRAEEGGLSDQQWGLILDAIKRKEPN
jgi:transcriptional regulator with XRE-family HTH domain